MSGKNSLLIRVLIAARLRVRLLLHSLVDQMSKGELEMWWASGGKATVETTEELGIRTQKQSGN